MSEKKKQNSPSFEEKKEKPTPAFLRDDYPFQAIGEPIADLENLKPNGVIYEIKCLDCGMSIRSQGDNVKSTYERMLNGATVTADDGTTRTEGGKGCLVCGSRNFIIKEVDMSRAKEFEAAGKTETKTDEKA